MPSQTAVIGLVPTVHTDVPIDAVFIALFVTLAASHMTLFQLNNRKQHKFLFSAMMFGFSMSRIVANILRIVWATQPSNTSVSLAASIFNNAGILLVYIVNNILSWRMIRSKHPSIGWHPVLRIAYKIGLWLVLPIIIMLIVVLCVTNTHPTTYREHILTDIARLGQTYFFIVAAQPLVLLTFAALTPSTEDPDHFGKRTSWNAKLITLYATTLLSLIEAGFRLGTAWQPARLATDPAWYDSKPAFYCFNFTIDVLILLVFLIMRFDLLFWIPNKASGPGSYSRSLAEKQANNGQESE